MTDKRTQLIETALTLFYQQGIHAVGINEILKTSGIAKKTLYNHFASKEELVAAVVEYCDDLFTQSLETAVNQVTPGEEAIKQIFTVLDDCLNGRTETLKPFRGCFFINASAEYSHDDCQIFSSCQAHKEKIGKLFLHHARVVLGESEQALLLADNLALLRDGAIIAAHMQGDKQAALKALDAAQILIAAYRDKATA